MGLLKYYWRLYSTFGEGLGNKHLTIKLDMEPIVRQYVVALSLS